MRHLRKTLIEDLSGSRAFGRHPPIDIEQAYTCLTGLTGHQPLRERPCAAHATVIYDDEFEAMASAEDVGRHNARDKAIGKLLLTGKLDRAAFAILSSASAMKWCRKQSGENLRSLPCPIPQPWP
ncbi:MAG: formate dehydrogenase accessory sulfurtransferase FdhD [Desulfobacterales bacterium]|nr:formate dehydrogenase accessory sulfurtransferase FdhD [Desulfobacterales bacterium]